MGSSPMTKNSDVERLKAAVIATSQQLRRSIDEVEHLRKEMLRDEINRRQEER
jgi:hypothetical protein